MSTAIPDALLDAVRKGNRFVLTSHVHPDGDAIGSELGLARVLRDMGKDVTIWNRDVTPRLYQPLPGSDAIHVGETPPAGFPDAFDAAIVLECPGPERTGHAEQIARLPVLNIDHHLGNATYGEVDWIDTAAPAVGEMVFRMTRALDLEIDATTATLLYLTLVTDTGGFRFSNTTAETFDAAAALVRRGAAPEQVSHWLFESQPVPVVRLLAELLGSLELHHGGKIATVWLTREMMQRSGAGDGDSEGLIDYPRAIAGVETVALFRQTGDLQFKVSLRSRGTVDVEAIARRFGGGGHKNAAGCSVDGSPETIHRDIVARLASALGS